MSETPYIFFDCDDTIFEWTVSWRQAFVQAAAEAGVTVSPDRSREAIEQAFGNYYSDCLRHHAATGDDNAFWLDYDGRILADLGVSAQRDQAAARVVEQLRQPGAVRLYDDVRPVLDELQRRGVRMGIITGRPLAGPDLLTLGLDGCFHPVLDAFGVGASKTEGTMFRLAVEAVTACGATGWHVGDSYDGDVIGSRSAGLRPILLDRRRKHPTTDCLRITNLHELLPMVLHGGGEDYTMTRRQTTKPDAVEVRSAGGVVAQGKGKTLRVAVMHSRYGTWVFPKGKIEPGEEPAAAAAREVEEEVGAAGLDITGPLGHTQHSYVHDGARQRKRVDWFLFRAGPAVTLRPNPAEYSLDCGWFTPVQALELLSHQDQRRLLRKALALLDPRPPRPRR